MERKEKPHGGLARSHSPSQDPDVTWYALKRRGTDDQGGKERKMKREKR
jgi:hypothetical protein